MKKNELNARLLIVGCVMFFTTILLPDIFAAQQPNENPGYSITSGRLESIATLIVGIVSIVIGWRSMRPSNQLAAGNVRKGTVIALILGVICVILSGIQVANSSGFGTGGGKAGAIVAML